jgi:hypothetical protein
MAACGRVTVEAVMTVTNRDVREVGLAEPKRPF